MFGVILRKLLPASATSARNARNKAAGAYMEVREDCDLSVMTQQLAMEDEQ